MLASQLLDTIPSLMREWRRELQGAPLEGLSANQFRVLYFIAQGLNHSCVLAKQLGVTQAAMSKMVDHLASDDLLKRTHSQEDRRHITLNLTKKGETLLKQVRQRIEKRMQKHLDQLDADEQQLVSEAFHLMQKIFPQEARS